MAHSLLRSFRCSSGEHFSSDFPPANLRSTVVLGIVSLIGITLGLILIFGLGFGAMYFLWTLFKPPERPDDSETEAG